jgi:hypothetical protein
MRLAILADIHGNLPALEAVMVEMERYQPDSVVVDDDILITAHTHVQLDRQVCLPEPQPQYDTNPHGYQDVQVKQERCWRIINPGSIGLPLNGDVQAQFAILDSVSPDSEFGGWRCAHVRVPYDRRPALEAFESSGMLAAGGVISTLFYWELVTAEWEIPYFFRWAREHYPDPQSSMREVFAAYVAATGRDQYVRQRDPLFKGGIGNVTPTRANA